MALALHTLIQMSGVQTKTRDGEATSDFTNLSEFFYRDNNCVFTVVLHNCTAQFMYELLPLCKSS
jgi:hypothetical protein